MSANNFDMPQSKAVVWHDLPDPRDPNAPGGARTQLVLERWSWENILDKHVLPGREPWGDILSLDTFRNLRRSKSPANFGDPMVADAIARLESQVRQTLQRPLVLLLEVRRLGQSRPNPSRVWMLVLPSGAVAYVHERKKGNRLATCYFPAYSLVNSNRGFRWRRVASSLVLRYAIFDTQRSALLLPTPDTVRFSPRKGPVRELHSAIRFVTPASWGFCPDLEGCPWRGRLGEWSAAEIATARSRRRLKPRRPRATDEDEQELNS